MIIDIVTPDQRLFSGEATFVAAPAADGEIGFMERAAPLMSTLKLGEVRVATEGNAAPRRFAVASGYLESDGRKIVVLANRAIDIATVDTEFARERIAANEKRLAEATTGDSRAVFYQEEIAWQQHLLKLVGK
jgi:F-type H+-transporting ATPase subunit epsilon